jgi:PAS domain S-box-containing protein
LLDLAFDAIFTIESDSHRITYWNAGAERMYGYSRQEALGQVSAQLLHTRYPSGLQSQRRSPYELVTQEERWEGRLVQTRKDGAEIIVEGRWVLDRPAGRILEVNREITAEVETAERFRLLVESVKDYAIYMLDTEGRIRTWNEGARRIKGYDEKEILGTHFSAFYLPEDVQAGEPERQLKVARETGRVEEEGWRVRKDGSRFFASAVITALYDPSGKLTGYAKVTRDITARQLERQRLTELERSKSAFLNLVAHELRSPLTVLRGYLSMFRVSTPEQRLDLEERSLPALEAKTIEMSRLVDQMVEVARLEEGSLRLRADRVDLVTIAEETVEIAQALEPTPEHQLMLEPYPHELNVVGDGERIRIILSNLVSNAVKYSPSGGEVNVRLDKADGFARITVTDKGAGIPMAEQARLFTRFMRVERSDHEHVPGTGMGFTSRASWRDGKVAT